jgi:hypothetical protein
MQTSSVGWNGPTGEILCSMLPFAAFRRVHSGSRRRLKNNKEIAEDRQSGTLCGLRSTAQFCYPKSAPAATMTLISGSRERAER